MPNSLNHPVLVEGPRVALADTQKFNVVSQNGCNGPYAAVGYPENKKSL